MKLKTIFTSLSTIALLAFCTTTARAKVTAIKAGKVVDPMAGTVSNNQIILVENRKVKEIGANVRIPEGANVIDLSKSTVMPGLFDAHTHLCSNMQYQWDSGDYLVHSLNWRTGMRAPRSSERARDA